jgi:RHS repeat-associated protein
MNCGSEASPFAQPRVPSPPPGPWILLQDAFGNAVASTGSSSSPYMYNANSGYRDEGDAGLVHVGARYYDKQVGRFITRDTELDEHPYLYCEHDPANYNDPSGHSQDPNEVKPWIPKAGAAAAAVGGFVGPIVGDLIVGGGEYGEALIKRRHGTINPGPPSGEGGVIWEPVPGRPGVLRPRRDPRNIPK